ncbi:MAG: endonuclease III [Candidatus Bathyarchaeota archaeon]|nr:MAG: endonuclease III [Candidatus Bathyarchaeota archaeon]
MTEHGATKILHVLRNNFSIPQWADAPKDVFQVLIMTVLSQATADRNMERAFRGLSKRFPITPKSLADARVEEIEVAIRVAGLYRNKSKVIKEVSRLILEKFGGSLDFIYSLPFEESRKTLISLPGVGPKTADVVLLFCAGKPTLPVDTHVNRVSKRLRLVSPNADYEGVRGALQSVYSPKDYLPVHLLLISLGRRYCKARNPLCKPCPVNTLCPSRQVEK